MKTVTYKASENPHVGKFHCPVCATDVFAWKSSGMSELRPHFYCTRCSNAICRRADQDIVWHVAGSDQLEQITQTLPDCECGGQFKPGQNPKCPTCGHEFSHQNDPVSRLRDPHMMLINGAVKYDDDGPTYRLVIEDT